MRRVVFNMQDERPIWAPPAWVSERLRAALPADCELVCVHAPVSGRGDGGGVSAEALDAVRGAEVYFGLGLPRELLLAALRPPRLRWIHTGAAGVASLLHPELAGHDIVLTNSAGIHGPPIAETALGMILHFARGLDMAVAAQHRNEWDTSGFEAADGGVREISGAMLGIIGYGGIGRELASRAAALGMRVQAIRRGTATGKLSAGESSGAEGGDRTPDNHARSVRQPAETHARILDGPDALATLLGTSDFVVIAVPSTVETRGMIGPAELALLGRDAVLVNIARGDVVDEDALIATLQHRRIRGAGLDVFRTEPLPADSPLWQLDNVLITPHVSGTTLRYWEREAELMLDNLRRYLRGEPLRNVVMLSAGY